MLSAIKNCHILKRKDTDLFVVFFWLQFGRFKYCTPKYNKIPEELLGPESKGVAHLLDDDQKVSMTHLV